MDLPTYFFRKVSKKCDTMEIKKLSAFVLGKILKVLVEILRVLLKILKVLVKILKVLVIILRILVKYRRFSSKS